jgi:Cu/Ag efflux pump CusA
LAIFDLCSGLALGRFARQVINERLQEAKTRIPQGMQPTLSPVATAFGEVYQYVIEGKDHPQPLEI